MPPRGLRREGAVGGDDRAIELQRQCEVEAVVDFVIELDRELEGPVAERLIGVKRDHRRKDRQQSASAGLYRVL